MRKIYMFEAITKIMFWVIALFVAQTTFAQRTVEITANTEISAVILGDTTDTGERVDPQTIYVLEGDAIYQIAKTLDIGSKLHIRGEVADGQSLPMLVPIPNEENSYPGAINNQGDIVLENIYLTNKNGDGQPKWGGLRANAANTSIVLENCFIEFDKAAVVMLRKDGISVYMNNCVASKAGNWKQFNGNGRLIDTRGTHADTIIVTNTTFYLMSDRTIRNMGGEINYLKFDHNTGTQLQGMHGCLQLGKIHHAEITNNLFLNPIYGGNHPNTAEQTGPSPDNEDIWAVTLDTIFNDTELIMRNNNFAYSEDVINYWATNDSVNKPGVLAPLAVEALTGSADDAYFEEAIEFTNIPEVPMDFLQSIYSNPTAEEHPDNFADEIGIFNIDASFSEDSRSFTADDSQMPIGSHQWWEGIEPPSNEKHYVNIPPDTDISTIILGDTTEYGQRKHLNTVYVLEGDGIYTLSKTLDIQSKLSIMGEIADDEMLPMIVPVPNAENSYPGVINNQGDIELENIYITNKNGDGQPKWGGLRANGANSKVVIKNCILEYDKAAAVMLRKDGISVTMNNVLASKFGNWKQYNGNGRLLDTRGTHADSIIITNTTSYLMSDRTIRNMGGEINYLLFDHNTGAQLQGMHGCLQLGKIHEATITNNLFINPVYGGNHPNTSEQTGPSPDNENIWAVTMDTIFDDTNITMSNNNFAYTSDVENYWASNDSVSKPGVLAPLVETALGDAAENAYFEEVVTFNKMPKVPMDFLNSIYANPTLEEHPNNFADSIGIFNIDASYNTDSKSYTADTNGKPIGSLYWWDDFTGIKHQILNNENLKIYPNPVNDFGTIQLNLNKDQNVQISITDLSGKQMMILQEGRLFKGINNINFNASALPAGMMFMTIQSDNKTTTRKFIVK